MNIQKEGLESVGRYYGIYRGIVANNDDPKNLGRLQLKVPQIYGDDTYEYWAFPIGMYAGKGIGAFFIPNVGDKIWVCFENGDPSFPLWQYGWWGDNSEVPKEASKDVNVLQTTSGSRITLNDTDKVIKIDDPHGNSVILDDKGVSVVSSNISLGKHEKSSEPAVLGDTAMDLLNEFIQDLGKLKHIPTNNGMTYAISGSPNWNALVNKWSTKWEQFKSKHITLD